MLVCYQHRPGSDAYVEVGRTEAIPFDSCLSSLA